MKVLCAILGLGFLAMAARAGTTHHIPDSGVSVQFPDDWRHDSSDRFGYVIRFGDDKQRKIRIHLTNHKNISPAEAVERSAERIRIRREEQNHIPEIVLSSTPIITDSGIRGQSAEVGQQGENGPAYLTRVYFERPDKRIFCICIYHHGDKAFARQVRDSVVRTLRLET